MQSGENRFIMEKEKKDCSIIQQPFRIQFVKQKTQQIWFHSNYTLIYYNNKKLMSLLH
jgi:hypothetical protein